MKIEMEKVEVKAKSRMLMRRFVHKWKGRTFVYRKPIHWRVEHDSRMMHSHSASAESILKEAFTKQIMDSLCDKWKIGPVTREMHRAGLIHHGDQTW